MEDIFAGDSFFTLTVFGRTGLVSLSIVILLVVTATSFVLGRRFGVLGGVFGAVFVYWVLLWISPQIYYLYYIAIFDDLPWQWVIGEPHSLQSVFVHAFFIGQKSLSHISQGLGFWVVLGAGIVGGFRRVPL